MGTKAKPKLVKVPVTIDVLKVEKQKYKDKKRGKFTTLFLKNESGLTIDAIVWKPTDIHFDVSIKNHNMFKKGWSYNISGTIEQQKKSKKDKDFSKADANFKWIFTQIDVLSAKKSPKKKNDNLSTVSQILERVENNLNLDNHQLKNVTLERAEVYRYFGCTSCKRKRPPRTRKNCETCEKRGVTSDSKQICMILRNVTIKDSSGSLENIVIFNDECEKLLRKPTNAFSFDEEAELKLEEYLGATISVKISSCKARKRQYGDTMYLHGITNIKKSPDEKVFSTAIYTPDKVNGDGKGFVITDASPFEDIISQFGAVETSLPNMPSEIDTYQLDSEPPGHVLIINNLNFQSSSKKREGSNEDIINLTNTFKKLDFKVILKEDLNVHDFQSCMTDFKDGLVSDDVSSCVVVIMSHGQLNKIEMVDGMMINVWTDLFAEFHDSKFPEFTDRPKIFIFQSCQIFPENSQYDAPPSSFSDTLLCFPAIPGHYSYRNPEVGSIFIQLLCHIIERHAGNKDFVEMMDLTQHWMKNAKITVWRGMQKEEKKQMCYHMRLGFNKFRFNVTQN